MRDWEGGYPRRQRQSSEEWTDDMFLFVQYAVYE